MKLIKIVVLVVLASSYLFGASLGVNIGKANSEYSQTNSNGSIVLGNEPDESFNSYEIYTTLDKKIFSLVPYLSYTYNKNDDLKHQYVLLGLNKSYSIKSFDLYVGLVGGYGELKWEYNPLTSSSSQNPTADGFLGGVQLGISYFLTSSFALGVDAKYLRHKHETNLSSSSTSSTIEHDSTSVVGISLQYKY